jgi:predicted outer membrane lipoprotein
MSQALFLASAFGSVTAISYNRQDASANNKRSANQIHLLIIILCCMLVLNGQKKAKPHASFPKPLSNDQLKIN